MSRKAALLLWIVLVLCVGAQTACAQTLWAYYPFHENDFKDYSGNDHHGTPVDGPVTVLNSERGWVASFNAEPSKPSRINCGTDDPAAGGELTVSAWVYWQGQNGNWQGIAGKSWSYDDRSWILQLRDSDGRIQWGGSDRLNLHIFADAAPAIDEWQHLVGTCDGAESKVYINGEVVGEGAGGITIGATEANLTLGFGEDRDDYDESFNGLLDEVYILTRGLSQGQVIDLGQGIVPSFAKARNPNPADGNLAVMMALFRWSAGDGAVFHDVYLGTTPELGPEQLVGPRNVLTMYYYPMPLEPGTTYYWRVDEIEMDGVTVHEGDVWTFTAQALTAYHPGPADGANAVSPAPTLTWMPGQGALKHQVFLGDNLDAVTEGAAGANKGEVAETSFDPGDLEGATTYYWRVDEIGAAGDVQTGPVWSFATYLSVDGFESYTDEEGSRIYETWIDGWTNDTGSTVGYIEAPFAEQTIIHGGLQSMPLDYNNINAPFYSEAEQTFSPAQDWTVSGCDTLVLYVRGGATNGPGPVYVAIQDASNHTAVVVHPNADLATTSKWTEWAIPLSDLTAAGVDVSRVKTMYIGVGDRDNPTAGGAGLLYVDDIYLIKSAAGG